MSKQFRKERGAVLLLTAMLALLLAIMVALVIDLTFFYSAKEEHERLAEMGAVAGLNAFLAQYDAANPNSDDDGDSLTSVQEAVSAALTRIKEVSKKNIIISHSGTELSDTVVTDEFATGTTGADGDVSFGRWWPKCPYLAPDGVTQLNCPCSTGDKACFEIGDPSLSGNYGQAVRVRLKLDPSGHLIPTIFGRVMGFSGFGSDVMATASNIPLHGLFLVDISRSMQSDTHLERKSPPVSGEAAEIAFKLAQDHDEDDPATPTINEGGDGAYDSCVAGLTPNGRKCDCSITPGIAGQGTQPCHQGSPDNTTGCLYYNIARSAHHIRYYGSPEAISEPGPRPAGEVGGLLDSRSGATAPATIHYKDDYRCYTVDYLEKVDTNSDGLPDTNQSRTDYYLVDNYQNLGVSETNPIYYPGPQPLATVLTALFYASKEFEGRHVNGDMMGAIFFDEVSSTINKRFFELTEPDYLNNSRFRELRNAVQVINDPDSGVPPTPAYPQNIAEHLLFPRRIGGHSGNGGTGVNTNIWEVLYTALDHLNSAPGSQGSSNFVVLISDGLTVCDTSGSCVNDGQHWYDSFYDGIYNGIMPYYMSQEVAIHYMAVGDQIAPNTLNIKNTDGTYITDEIARNLNIPYVYHGNHNNTRASIEAAFLNRATVPFYYSNFMFYTVAYNTNGYYFPLRDPDPDPTLQLTEPPTPTTYASPGVLKDGPDVATVQGYSGPMANEQQWVQPENIQLYDAESRVLQRQVRDYMRDLFKWNSIVLVEETQ